MFPHSTFTLALFLSHFFPCKTPPHRYAQHPPSCLITSSSPTLSKVFPRNTVTPPNHCCRTSLNIDIIAHTSSPPAPACNSSVDRKIPKTKQCRLRLIVRTGAPEVSRSCPTPTIPSSMNSDAYCDPRNDDSPSPARPTGRGAESPGGGGEGRAERVIL